MEQLTIIVLIAAVLACFINQVWHAKIMVKALKKIPLENQDKVNPVAKSIVWFASLPFAIICYNVIAGVCFVIVFVLVYGIAAIVHMV